MRRALLKEKEQFGYSRDGSGKRYRVGVYLVLGGAPEKAADFIAWYEKAFPDDIGEPVFHLFAALAYHRTGNPEKARHYLQAAMLSNLYLLPYLFSEPLAMLDMWHASNFQQPDYLYAVEEFLSEPTEEERGWIKAQFASNTFTMIRNKYVETFHALQYTQDMEQRHQILQEWYRYEAIHPHRTALSS